VFSLRTEATNSFIFTPLSVSVTHFMFRLQIPNTITTYSLDIPVKKAREQLRKEFMKNAHVRDPRMIDLLVVKVCVCVCVCVCV